MSIGRMFRRWLSTQSTPIVIDECRQCGTTLSDEVAQCPHCDSTSISHYEI